MKKIYYALMGVLTTTAPSFNANAQEVQLEWAASSGSTEEDVGRSIATDGSGNTYVTGSFWGTVDFDPGSGKAELTSKGDRDIFVQKLDGNGNLLWAKSMGGTGSDDGMSIAVDGSGNVLISGHYSGMADFDPGSGTTNLTSVGFTDVFIMKMAATGNLTWAKSVGGEFDDYCLAVTADGSGNVFVSGNFKDSANFDPGSGTAALKASGSQPDAFVLKLDGNGNFDWAKDVGGFSDDSGNSLATDASGNVYMAGHFSGKVDFEPGPGKSELTSKGARDGYILKLNNAGNYVWAKSVGGASIDYCQAITVDGSGNIFVTGYYSETVDFDPGSGTTELTSNGNADVFVIKLAPNGSFDWARGMGGSLYDVVVGITHDGSGNVYVCGFFEGTADFDPGTGTSNLTSNGNYDGFVLRLDQNGDFKWAASIGGSSIDEAYSVATHGSNVFVTGGFRGTVDFDPNSGTDEMTASGKNDVFVQKLSQASGPGPSGVNETVTFRQVTLYPNPVERELTLDPGLSTAEGDMSVRIINANGQEVYQALLDPSYSHVVSTDRWNTGIYYCQILIDGQYYTHTLFKQ